MKILRSRKNAPPRTVIEECYCGCKFSVDEHELIPRTDEPLAAWTACPECHKDISVDKRNLCCRDPELTAQIIREHASMYRMLVQLRNCIYGRSPRDQDAVNILDEFMTPP